MFGCRTVNELSDYTVNPNTSMSSIKRDVKKKVLPRRQEKSSPSTGGREDLSRDPAHFTVRVPLDLRERFRFLFVFHSCSFPRPVVTTPIESGDMASETNA